MRVKDFAFVGAKVFGIFAFIKGIEMLLNLIVIGVIYPSPTGIKFILTINNITSFFFTIFFWGMSIVLLGFTGKIIKFLVPQDENIHEESVAEGKLDRDDLQIVAFNVVGLVLLSVSIPKIFYDAADILVYKDNFSPLFTTRGINPISFQLIARILGHLIYLFIGIHLVFGFKKFIAIIGEGFSRLRKSIVRGDENGKNFGDDGDDYEKPDCGDELKEVKRKRGDGA